MTGRERSAIGPVGVRVALAILIGVVVAALALRGMVTAGAGVYYDDGVYLSLGQSLAQGDGYAYANLPGDIPGVKYPPAYPVVLATALKLLPPYPENLGMLKALNALLMGLAASLSFLVFTAAWGLPRRAGGSVRPDVVMPDTEERIRLGPQVALGVFAIACLLGYGSAQSMVLSTALLSEPLFLVAAFGALSLAGRRASHPVVLGLLAAAAFLTRGIGLAVVLAVILAELLRKGSRVKTRVRRLGLLAGSALVPVAAWIAWSRSHAAEVPASLRGQYGTYGGWYADGLGGTVVRLREIVAAHWTPFLTNLEILWIPDASRTASNFVLLVLGAVAIVGALRLARANLSLVLFPIFYLAMVFAWPYEPDRFFYAILPALTLFVAAGGLALTERIRADLPRWGGPLAAVAAAVLLFNSAVFEIEAHQRRAWAVFQAAPAAAFAPLNEWIRQNTPPDAVVASGLDPLIHWETGRKAVPNFQFLAADYGRYDGSPETLVGEFEEIVDATGAGWVAVVRGEGKAGATMAAFAQAHPERARLAVENDDEATGVTGEIWEVLPSGEAFPDTVEAP